MSEYIDQLDVSPYLKKLNSKLSEETLIKPGQFPNLLTDYNV